MPNMVHCREAKVFVGAAISRHIVITNAAQQDLIDNGWVGTADWVAHEINIITNRAAVIAKQLLQRLQASCLHMGRIEMGQHVRK